jgi:2-oxoglutarate ferredoxin oxidoreductase subunit gamma
VNTTVFEGSFDADEYRVVELAATDLAVDLGNIMTASMVMLGAYVAATGMVALDSLERAVTASLPSYRTQHVARNVTALRAGFEVAPRDLSPAWSDATTTEVLA